MWPAANDTKADPANRTELILSDVGSRVTQSVHVVSSSGSAPPVLTTKDETCSSEPITIRTETKPNLRDSVSRQGVS